MSLTGPSRTGAISVVLLGLIAVALFLILAALDRFHGETRELARAIDRLEKRVGVEADRVVQGRGTGSVASTAEPAGVAPARPAFGDMLVMHAGEPATFNRWTTGVTTVRVVCNYIHDGLFNLDPETLEPRPALATSWELSADRLRYVFRLRRDVVFSDGTPFTARDVVFTLGVIQDPEVKSDHCKQEFADIERTETPDDHTVVFHCRRPYWRGIHSLGLTLRPMSAIDVRRRLEAIAAAKRAEFPTGSYELEPGQKGFGRLYNQLHEPANGTGPYRWDPELSLKKGVHLTLYRSESSWWFTAFPGKWNLAALRWRFVNDQDAALQEVRKQAIDLKTVDHEKWYDDLQHDPSITDHFAFQQYDHVGIGHSLVFWNCRRPLFADRRVRQALAHLIDRRTMREVFNKGVDDYATCVFKRIYPEYSPDIEPRLLDLPRAKQLLAEAGWRDGNGDGVLDRDGLEFRFTLMYPTGRDEYKRWAELWQHDLKKAGVAMEVLPIDWPSFQDKFYDHEFDAAPTYYSHDDPWIEPYEQYVSSQTGKGQSNHSGWHLPEVDDLLERARVEFDPVKRRELYHRFNHIRDEHQPEMLLLHGKVSVVVHKRFRNVKVTKAGLVFEDWFVPEADRLYEDDGSRRRR